MEVPVHWSPLPLATSTGSTGHHSLSFRGLLLRVFHILSSIYQTTQLNLRQNFVISFSLFYFSCSYAAINVVKVEFCRKNTLWSEVELRWQTYLMVRGQCF